jgi:hypothetical protein
LTSSSIFFFLLTLLFVLHSLVIIIQIVHISRLVAAIDVTDPFLHSWWSRRKEICRVTWHNCALAFVHAVCHHFIYVSFYIYITPGHDTLRLYVFFCVSCLSKHAFTISCSFPLILSACLSVWTWTLYLSCDNDYDKYLSYSFSDWLVVIFFKCGHSEIWVIRCSKVEVKLTFTCVIYLKQNKIKFKEGMFF